MQAEVNRTWELPRPPQEVWSYLTERELLSKWLMETDMRPVVGRPFRFTCETVTECEILEAEPFVRLVYTWRPDSTAGGATFTSKVAWTLSPMGNGTQLQLVHDGFPTGEEAIGHDSAWKMTVGKMAEMMNDRSYRTHIEIAATPRTIFNALGDAAKWWTEDFEGSSKRLNDEFVIHHPGQHYSKQKVVEVVEDKRLVWLVTDSRLSWLKGDQQEWTNTRIIFELSANGDKTVLHFTHEGIVPEKECYARIGEGWSIVIGERLLNYIS
jgi:uncharacterized protein YndB with AHSA1/START domain